MATERRYGGAGCSVAGPPVDIFAEPAKQLTLELQVDVDTRAREELEQLEAKLSVALDGRGARVKINAMPPQHVGLGSKTALLLATATATLHVAEVATSRSELSHLSGRGGTSGAGINLFFEGGFVVDGGHFNSSDQKFGPSSEAAPGNIPPVLAHHPIPEGWRFHLIQAAEQGASGSAERDLFRRTTPLPRDEILETLAALHHAVLPGFALADLDLVSVGLRKTHSTGFKRRELDIQPQRVRDLYLQISSLPATAVGLSSVGPLLFAITDSEKSRERVNNLIEEAEADLIGCVGPVNSGYTLQPR